MKKLDEKGFVFLDDASRPYHVAMWGNRAWLFYWHADNKWVSQRIVTQTEVWEFAAKKLPDEKAAMYFPEGRLIAREEVKP